MARAFGATLGVATTDLINTKYATGVTTTISMSVWSNRNGDGGSAQGRMIDQFFSGNQNMGVALYNDVTGYLFQCPFSVTIGIFSFPRPTTGGWHHIAVAYDASNVANVPDIWLDGVKQTVTTTSTPVGTVTTLSGTWFIGNRSNAGRNWDGLISHAAIWNGYMLKAPEVSVLAAGCPPTLVKPENIGMYCPLDGVNNPEMDYMNGLVTTVTGTKLGLSEPPVVPAAAIPDLFVHSDSIGPQPPPPPPGTGAGIVSAPYDQSIFRSGSGIFDVNKSIMQV